MLEARGTEQLAVMHGGGGSVPMQARSLKDDVALLRDALSAAMRSAGSDDVLDSALEPEELSAPDAQLRTRALTRHLQLINLAEDNDRIRRLRREEVAAAPSPYHGSVHAAIAELAAAGVGADGMRSLLEDVEVRLVLTAHPTEARRRTSVEKLARAFAELRRLDERAAIPREEVISRERVRAVVEELWRTDETRSAALTVMDEVAGGLAYLGTTLYEVVPRVYRDLELALAAVYPEETIVVPPMLRFGSWIGGDRDGNPNVTPEVTVATLGAMRDGCLTLHEAHVRRLAPRISVSTRLEGPPGELLPLLSDLGSRFPAIAEELEARLEHEPYRRALELIAARIAETRVGGDSAYEDSAALRADLRAVAEALRARGAARIASDELADMVRRVEVFGFHFGRLDIREHAKFHRGALGEMFRASGVHEDYASLEAGERYALLDRELANPRPLLAREVRGFTDSAREVIATFDMLREVIAAGHGGALSRYIISHASSGADMLEVLLLMRESGLAGVGGARARLRIAPLLEADSTLRAGPQIVADALGSESYRRALEATGGVQEVMIGYSDSNKDVGFVASMWVTHKAQSEIAAALSSEGVRYRFFHGRGGSIGRGGGPTNLAILAQPRQTLESGLDLTEQGEVIATKYSSTEVAERELELIANAVLRAAGGVASEPSPDCLVRYERVMEEMAVTSRAAYRALVHTGEEMAEFFRAATPMQDIEKLRLGSRPASRSGSGTIDDLRAIPWVFSWTQSRIILPGWFGLGTALAGARASEGDDVLREMARDWPFFVALLSTAEMGLAKTDMGIAEEYVGLVPASESRDRIWAALREEHALAASELLRVTGQDALLERDPLLRRSIERRVPYLEDLAAVQVEMLRRVRAGDADPELARASAMTVNGIAGGLRNTG